MKKRLISAFLTGLLFAPQLVLAGPDPRGILDLEGYTTSDSVGVEAKRYRGDPRELSALKDGDSLFHIKGYGYDGSSVPSTNRGSLKLEAVEDWNTSENGTYWTFQGTPVNTETPVEIMRVGDMVSGLFVAHENFIDPIAVDSNTVLTDIVVTTGALGGLTTTYTAAASDFAAQPVHPRVLSWIYVNTAGSSTGTITFTGVNANGDTITEDATLNAAACNVDNVLNNAFATVTSVAITFTTHTSTGNELFFVGTSSAIGLANDVYYSTNVFKVIENAANVSSGYTINPTYDTYLPATTPNGTVDYSIWYRATKSPL